MSFADIESGVSRNSLAAINAQNSGSAEDAAFNNLQNSLSLQVLKINANVQGILKLVDQLGTGRDSPNLRKSLHDLTETTRAMAKRGSDDLKKLAGLQVISNKPGYKAAVDKTTHDFKLQLVGFQRAQQVSAERQRTVVEGVKIAVDDDHPDPEGEPGTSPAQRQAQLFQAQLSPAELQHQEQLIQEREQDIREIETGIHELHEIFRDLGTLVADQGTMIDNIESNISSVAADTEGAARELTTAADYQRKAGRRAACLMIIVVFVVCIVLLAVLS